MQGGGGMVHRRAVRTGGRSIRPARWRRLASAGAATAVLATVVIAVALPATRSGAAPSASLSLTKTASVTNFSSAGTTITYTYTVTNTGTNALYNLTVSDPMAGLSSINCGGNSPDISTLAAGASVACTATYTTTQADLDAGAISNTGTVASVPGANGASHYSATASLTIPALQVPQLSLIKTASPAGFSLAGVTITYTFQVQNTGNVTLTNVTVTDPLPGLSAINCGGNSPTIPTMAPGQIVTCTATYVTTATDVKNKGVLNTATANGLGPNDAKVSSRSQWDEPAAGAPFDCVNPGAYLSQSNSLTALPPTAAITLYSSSTYFNSFNWQQVSGPYLPTYNALGYNPLNDYLYATLVRPTTNAVIRIDGAGNVTVAGPLTPLSGSFNFSTNGPDVGAFDGTGNYWFTQSGSSTAWMVPASDYYPTQASSFKATARPLSLPFGAADWTWTPAPPNGNPPAGGYLWGLHGGVIYRVSLTASGTLPVTTYTAPLPSPYTTSSAGADWTYGSGALGFSNNQTGAIFEIVPTFAGNNANNPPTFTLDALYTGPLAGTINDGAACVPAPVDLGIVKNGPATVTPGGTVTWTLTVTNYGPGNSSGYTVVDPVPAGVTNVSSPTPGCTAAGNTVTCLEGVLDAGNSFTMIVTGTAPTTPDACFTNTATVTGNEQDPNAKNNTSGYTTCVSSGLVIQKSASVTSYSAAGETITYTYVVTNNDPWPLYNVAVTDPMPGLSPISCGAAGNPITVLNPSQSVTCTATYTTTQTDVNVGSLTNTGTASAETPVGNFSSSSSVTIPAKQDPSLSLVKSSNVDEFDAAGIPVTFTFAVTNTGNVTLTNVTVTDPLPGISAINCGGNSPTIPTLAPGQTVYCTATYTTTAEDVQKGGIDNIASAIGDAPNDTTVTASGEVVLPYEDGPFDCTSQVDFLSQSNASGVPPTLPINLWASSGNLSNYVQVGSGNTPTYNALGYDPLNKYLFATDIRPSAPRMIKISAAGTVIASEPIGAPYTNSNNTGPDVGAFDAAGNYYFMVSGTTVAWRIPAAQITSFSGTLTPTKITLNHAFAPADWSLIGSSFWGAFGKMLYEMTPAAVTGTVTSEAAPGPVAAVGAVDPTFGAAWSFGNGDLGISNNVTGKLFEVDVTGVPVSIAEIQGPTAQQVNDGAACVPKPTQLAIKKTGPATVLPNGTITWTITVTNLGPNQSSGFVVDDPIPAGVTGATTTTPGCTVVANMLQCVEGTLNVGNSFTITVTGTAPPTPGACVTNTAEVIGNEAEPHGQNPTSSVVTCVTQGIHIIKTSPLTNFSEAGTVIPYTFTVTDTLPGSSAAATKAADTLSDVTVTDDVAGLSEITCGSTGTDEVATLSPGASAVCHATLTVSPADAAAGTIVNVATATAVTGWGVAVSDRSDDVTTPRGLHVITSSLPIGTDGKPYHATLVAVGASKVTWSLGAGSLPKGLKLSASGVLSGTLGASGVYDLVVDAVAQVGTGSKAVKETATATLVLVGTVGPKRS